MFKNLSVRWQLGVGFSSVVTFFVATLLTIGFLLADLTRSVGEVNEISLPLVLAVDEMDLSRSEVQQFLTDVSATHDPAGYKDAEESAKRFHDAIDKFKQHYSAVNDQAKLGEMASIESHFNAFYDLGKKMAAAYIKDGMEAGNALMKGSDKVPGFDSASEVLEKQLTTFRKEQIERAKQASSIAYSSANSIQHTMLVGGILVSLLAAAISAVIVHALMVQLGGEPKLAAQLTQSIGAGDLSFQIPLRSGDTSSLMAQLQAMQSSLTRVVGSVRQEAEGVATASTEIAQGNHDLSARTENQASALEEIASSMQELISSVKKNAESANQADKLSHNAVEVAVAGGAVVDEVVETMRHINDSSGKIFDIISVIDGIAFQTNILALNAAVEAARAGEQGRGFAVVASEVRSLAGRSAEAAKEVKNLITNSVDRVEEGNVLVARAGLTMKEVIGSIQRVTDFMDHITSNSSEQSDSVSQIGQAVNQMEQVTQQNAALVEEMAAAASSLRSQSDSLVGTVSVFKV
ncbi:MAG: chemotaxis protein [Rhodoferax sp.]|nr:chemotaxis protein [Rhodoferax sp.]